MTSTSSNVPAAGHRIVPLVRVRVAGGDLDDNLARTLGAIRVRRALSMPAAGELEFVAPPAVDAINLGDDLDVRVEGHESPLFIGTVVAIEDRFGADGIHRLRVRAHDAAHRLRSTGEVRTHTDTDIAGLARTLFGETGLSVHTAIDGPTWPRLLQRGESDLAFFDAMCRQAGLWWQVVDDRLTLISLVDGDDRETHDLMWGLDLLEASVTRSAVTATDTVKVAGWDLLTAAAIDGKADNGDAADLLGADAKARTRTLSGYPLAGDGMADSLAGLTIGLEAAAAGVLTALVVGDPELRPGGKVGIVTGGAHRDGQRYVLTTVDHLVDDASGFVSVLSSAPPDNSVSPTLAPNSILADSSSITLGKVLAVDDPNRAGRVRVALPAYEDVETDWLPVLALGAGPDKGLDCQPDVDDLVLLAHTPGNPTAAIVLGGLHGDRAPAEGAGVGDGGVRRYGMRTPDGQFFVLNRDTDGVMMSNQAGSTVRIDEAGIVVHSAGDLTLESPGHAMRLRASSIDLEQA